MISDGQMIASKCDGCILVVRAHDTPRNEVKGSIQQIESVGCTLLGVVLNRIEGRRARGYYPRAITPRATGNTTRSTIRTLKAPAARPSRAGAGPGMQSRISRADPPPEKRSNLRGARPTASAAALQWADAGNA